jgi:hypothetical protein
VRNKFRGCELKKDISYKGQEGIVLMSEEQWEEETKKLAYRALDSHVSCKLNQLINVRLKKIAVNKVQEDKFAKDKSKIMLTMKSNPVFNIDKNKHSAKSEAIFDDLFEFAHRRIRFGISCFNKKDAIEKLVKLYQFKKIFLTNCNEVPVIKREIVNPVMEPSEYPASAISTEGLNQINQLKEMNIILKNNKNICSVPYPCNKYGETSGEAITQFGAEKYNFEVLEASLVEKRNKG